MSWKDVFLRFHGRIGRSTYWLAGLAIFAYLIVLGGILIGILASSDLPLSERILAVALPFVVLSVPAAYAGMAIAVKRLHDRDKSGWWVIPYYWLPGVLDQAARRAGEGTSSTLIWMAGTALSIWVMIELGFLRGTLGPNRFGPDPLDPGSTLPERSGNIPA